MTPTVNVVSGLNGQTTTYTMTQLRRMAQDIARAKKGRLVAHFGCNRWAISSKRWSATGFASPDARA